MTGQGQLTRAIGLMSGTSIDGIDVALIETDGRDTIVPGPTGAYPYGDDDRALLRDALAAAATLIDRAARPQPLDRAERLITDRHAEAVERFLAEHGLNRRDIDLVGFHGQTVLHRPEHKLTVQIGCGDALAARLGMAVVADMRAADVAQGGQGAPLVPVFHQALARATGLPLPCLVVNIGGVANITFVAEGHDPLACDTGPGNALLDDLMLERTGAACDRDGAAAAAGMVDAAVLSRLMAHRYFDLAPPKSLDRNAFSREPVAVLSLPDAAATLTAFTADSIAHILRHLPQEPVLAVVCGGGAHNPTLMRALARALPCRVESAKAVGWQPDFIEAQAFAYLAVRSRRALPLTFPSTTGVDRPSSGGVFFEVA